MDNSHGSTPVEPADSPANLPFFPSWLFDVAEFQRQYADSRAKWCKAIRLGLIYVPRAKSQLGPDHPFAHDFDVHERWLLRQAEVFHISLGKEPLLPSRARAF